MFAASKTAAAAAGTPPASTDPQFNYVTMLLHGDGTNGAQNNTFVDSSTNNFTITRNGTPTQGSFSPYGDLWSNYFSGSGQYLTTSSVTFAGDFTVEGWVFINNLSAARALVQIGDDSTSTGPIFFVNTSGKFAVSAASNLFTGSITIAANTWVHLAVARSGSTIKSYVNGVLDSTITNSTTFTGAVRVGAEWYAGSLGSVIMNGYISNLRLVTGTALYTSNFTPSTTPLTAVSGTSLLTCQSNRFKDNSSNNFAITVTGTPSVQRFSPFEPATGYDASVIGGSGIFATSNYLSFTGTNSAFQFGTGDWTVECWVYLNTVNADSYVWDFRPNSNGAYPALDASSAGFKYVANAAVVITGTTAPKAGTWYHVAVARSGTSTKLFVNGVQEGSTYSDSTNYTVASNRPYVGVDSFSGSSFPFNGYISNLRIVKGTAVYTAAFTPPTAPLTAITNTSLLLNTVNAGIFDNAMMNDLVTVGDAQVSTAVVKYGTGSMKFDGTGDYLSVASSQAVNFGSGDFTVEYWTYPTSFSGGTGYIQHAGGATNTSTALSFGEQGGFPYATTSTVGQKTTTSLSLNTWNYVAWTRSGTTLRCFLNGSLINTFTNTVVVANTTVGVGGTSAGLYPFAGYIDDLRITTGVARYTANFTPPTAAFPNN